jgi:hypothetical protein
MMMMNMTVSGAREGHHRRENIQTFNHPSSRGSRQVVTSYIVMLGQHHREIRPDGEKEGSL